MYTFARLLHFILCICLSLSLLATATQANKPTFIQTLKKDWKKAAIITTGALAILGTAAITSFAGWKKYKWDHMSPFEKSKHLPESTVPLKYEPKQLSSQEKHQLVEQIKVMVHDLNIQGWTIGDDDNVNIFNQPPAPPYTLLGWAVKQGNVELTKLLLEAHANVNEGTTGDGHTPLTTALRLYYSTGDKKYYQIMELLLKHGGIFHNSNLVERAMDYQPEIYSLLTKYGFRGNVRLYRETPESKFGSSYQV